MSQGCNGGQPSGAWKWFTKTGVVSGGDYADVGKGTSCEPYSLQSCAHHVDPPAGMVACDTVPEYDTPKCASTCEAGYKTAYGKDKHLAKSSYSVKGVANMQKELMERGTLSVSLTVYEDFPTYTSGVYTHKTGKSLGGHAIKVKHALSPLIIAHHPRFILTTYLTTYLTSSLTSSLSPSLLPSPSLSLSLPTCLHHHYLSLSPSFDHHSSRLPHS